MDSRQLALARIYGILGPDEFIRLATVEFVQTQVMPEFRDAWYAQHAIAIAAQKEREAAK